MDADTQLPYDSFETPSPSPNAGRAAAVLGFLLPVASIGAGILGIALGATGGWMAHPDTRIVESEPVYDVSDIRFVAACLPMVAEKTTRIEELNLEIDDLRGQVKDKAARVRELEAKTTAHGGKGGGASSAELANAREELANLRLQYAQVMTEKSNLVAQLTETQQQLTVAESALTETRAAYEQQVGLTDAAEEDASANKYARFIGESQLAVCEKGGRKKMGDCRSELTAALSASSVRDTFFRCVRSGQAVPVVREAEDGASLPSYSSALGDTRVLKGWYVTNCDPTLPEARLARLTPPAYSPMGSAMAAAAAYLPSAMTSMAPAAAMMPTNWAPAPVVEAPPAVEVPAAPSSLDDTLSSLASVLPAAAEAYIAPTPPPPPVRVAPPPTSDPLGLDDVDVGPYVPVAARAAAASAGDGVNIDDILGEDDPARKARTAAPSAPAAPARSKSKDEAPSRSYDLTDEDLGGLEDL
jgi:hypothetical protein